MPQILGKKAAMETRVGRGAEPLLDVGRCFCPSGPRLASRVRRRFCNYSCGQSSDILLPPCPTLIFKSDGQIVLACMTTCGARFAMGLSFRTAVIRISRAPARPDDEELELTVQEGYESREDRGMPRPGARPGTRPGTSPSTRHNDMSCKLSERGVEPGDSRMLSEILDKATSGDSIQWQVFESSIVSEPR